MELPDAKKVCIGNLEFYIRFSLKALLRFTNVISKEPDNNEIVIQYFYDLAKAGAKSEGKEFNYTYDEFLDAIDPYPDSMEIINDAISVIFNLSGEKKTEVKK